MRIAIWDASKWGLLLCLAGAGMWDLRTGRVPNKWVAFWYGAGLCISAWGGVMAAGGYLGRSFAVVAVLFPLFLCRMMGAGDIKSMALICGYLGSSEGIRAIGAGMALASVWGLVKLLRRGILRDRLRYLAAYLARVFRERKAVAYDGAGLDRKGAAVPLVFFLFLGWALLYFLEAIGSGV